MRVPPQWLDVFWPQPPFREENIYAALTRNSLGTPDIKKAPSTWYRHSSVFLLPQNWDRVVKLGESDVALKAPVIKTQLQGESLDDLKNPDMKTCIP